jgi:1-acyl-sn-glycerol-3-phosphate acyltransferase
LPRSPALFIRSLLFNVLFYVNIIVRMIVALPTIVLPRSFMLGVLRRYARSSLWLLRVVCGVSVEWRGREKIPQGACIVACKHQSFWETFALFEVLRDPTYVLKRELMWLPLFGWLAQKSRMIPIDRGARVSALGRMAAAARRYGEIGLPCVPIALNSGLFWPRRSLLRFPGTVLVEVLDPIPPGLNKREFLARLQSVIEEATTRLVAEGRQQRR